mgnify:CR=1 FL=1
MNGNARRTIRLSFLLSLLVGTFVYFGCSRRDDMQADAWQTDTSELENKIPFLGRVTSCSWKVGVAQDRSRGVPGPSAYFLRGSAVISPEDETRIRSRYSWTAVPNFQFENLSFSSGLLPPVGPVFVSSELVRALPTLATYHQGEIYYFPESHTIVFDLIKG